MRCGQSPPTPKAQEIAQQHENLAKLIEHRERPPPAA